MESNEVCGKVVTTGGGLYELFGVSCFCITFCCSVFRVHISSFGRREILRSNVDFGGSSTAAGAGTSLVEYLADSYALLDV
jgi:hypothetical protein